MAQSHWGRPAPDYFSAYNFATAIRSPPPTEIEALVLNGQALDAIRRVYLLFNNKEKPELDTDSLASQIPLSWLTTILDAICSPSSFILLTGEMLVAVCIRLMSTIKSSGKCSPFSYEYGYVCFRIVMLGLGVNLLHRAEELKDTTKDMEWRTNTICLEVFSERISQLILEAIHANIDLPYYDFILGWASRNNHELKKPLVDPSNSALLLNLLYNDRKLFLEVLKYTYSPGLPGLYLVLWRSWRLKWTGQEQHDYDINRPPVASQLSEIVWRYCLVAPVVQEVSMSLIYRDMAPEMRKRWKPGFVDIQDARNITRTFVDRLAIQADDLYIPLCSITSGLLINFVQHYVTYGAIDMIPSLLRNFVRHEWYMVVNGQLQGYEPPDQTVDGTRMVLESLTSLLEAAQPVPFEFAEELVECTLGEDLFGLVTRLIFELETAHDASDHEAVRRATFPSVADRFYRILCAPLPQSLIRSKFNDPFRDWLKCQTYFEWRLLSTRRFNSLEWKHWLQCTQYYINIRDSMQQHDTKKALYTKPCAYTRCPDPHRVTGAQYVCNKCGTFYCSMRCQDADWKNGNWQKSHRGKCGSSVNA